MQSISGIITQTHVSTGEIPPPLVGSSISIVDDLVLVFAGRLVTSRKMTNHLYVLNLKTLVWTRHIPPPDSDKAPKPRYFHSTNTFGRSLVIFGGMGYSRHSEDGLCVLDDVAIFDIDTMSWKQPEIQPSLFAPRPRYAHLATISKHHLFVIGGQDMDNGYLTEINVLDLHSFEWVRAIAFDQHVGAYRSVVVATPVGTSLPTGMNNNDDQSSVSVKNDNSTQNDPSARSRMSILYTDLDYNPPTDTPGPIFMYSNYNFADVNRELQLITRSSFSTKLAGVDERDINQISVENVSDMMTGSVMPPGLRFPTGDVLGQHMVIAGTYLSPQNQSYSLWGLNTVTLAWTRVDTGEIFNTGSWNRGVLDAERNRYLIFGNMHRNLLEDYNHRQVNFEHMATVDLEAFGIYQQPKMSCSPLAQEMGLRLLNEPTVADFYVITRDSQEIPVNSAILRHRWPYFAKLLEQEEENEGTTMDEASSGKPTLLDDIQENEEVKMHTDIDYKPHAQSMTFPYSYPVVMALLQYLYTDNLLTAQQYQPHILSHLLLLADMYKLPRLVSLATHALHQMLNMSTAPLVFETAALSHQTSLQIRALKLMIAAKKMVHQQQQQQQQINLQSQRQQRLSQYNGITSTNNNIGSDDWDTQSMASTTFQQQYLDQYQTLPTPTSSLSSSYPLSPAATASTSELDLNKQMHMSPTLGAHRGRTPSLGNRSMFSTNGGGISSPRQVNTLPTNRPSTALNFYGATRQTITTSTSNNSSGSSNGNSSYYSVTTPSYQHPPSSTSSTSSSSFYSSEPKKSTSSGFPFISNNAMPVKTSPSSSSTIPEDDNFSVSSFSMYGNQTTFTNTSNSSSSSKDLSNSSRRKQNRILNALGNKFSMSRS
ncbi:uncharacterized protein BX664DRAFT_341898 [Halteromyces radiatus]|uniref:uncharacterized protein n=1 Tax=Halteromyces radiatus TaxID=101107 RepID=UPI00221E91B7|nr:uncharacterized protein BX664DRAFT_341898 [Halteromyces radiatus]KAI8079959.1 hypothetical protein BX664DRAFT_341898 [Halteromyces radiatus]